MPELKDAWLQTAKSFVLAINDLGVSLAVTAKAGVDAAVEWAKKDNPHVQAEGHEIPTEEEPVEEAPAEEETPAEKEQPAETAE